MSPDKSDPLGQSRPAPRQLWLNRENMEQARDNWWQAFQDVCGEQMFIGRADRRTWDIAWAAAIAAHAFVWEGRTEPSR